MKGVSTVITTVIMVAIFLALVGTYFYSLSAQLDTMEKAVRIPENSVSCTGTRASLELRNLGDEPINNSNRNQVSGHFNAGPGMLAHWSFEEDSNVSIDSSGNGYHGTLHGDTVLLMRLDEGTGYPLDSTSNANHGTIAGHEPEWQPSNLCKSGRCMKFDGADDNIDLANSLGISDSSFTISHWIKTTKGDPQMYTIGNAGAGNGFRFGIGGGRVAYLIGNSGGHSESVVGSTFVNDGEWHMITGVYDRGNAFTAYVDGQPDGSVPILAHPGMNDMPPRIGDPPCCSIFGGLIDELVVYNRTLSPNEVKAQYDAGKARFIERVPGRVGYAMNLSDKYDYIIVPNFASSSPSSEITVSIWVKVPDIMARTAFSMLPQDPTNRLLFHPYYGVAADSTYWDFGDITTTGRLSYDIDPAGVGSWQHFLLVSSQSGNFMAIYRNGVQEAYTNQQDTFVNGARDFMIGGRTNGFNGLIDELTIWNRAFDASDILDLFQPSCSCAGQSCQCGELTLIKTHGQGDFQPFFDSGEIPGEGSVTMTDYNCLSRTCGYRVVSPSGSEEVFADCR
jgi:hypothetical protein